MHTTRPLIFYSVLAGVLQIVCGLAALAWAWPLFADPPFLGNGLTREYSAIRQLLADSSGASELLDGLRFKLQWLFQRQSEGVFIGLGLGFVLLLCGAVSMFLGARAWRLLRQVH